MKKLIVLSLLSLLFVAPTFAQQKEFVVEAHTRAVFADGEKAMYDYMRENITYPADAKEAKIQGTIFVEFIVEKDGKISNARVMRGENPSLQAEALRFVKTMPNWTPGKDADGNIVRSSMTLPIRFTLDN